MAHRNISLIAFILLSTVMMSFSNVRAEETVGKIKADFMNHPVLAAENFSVEIKDFKQGFLSLYIPRHPGKTMDDMESSYGKKWKDLMEKAEALALKNPEVRDVTWFVKGDGGSEDAIYYYKRRYFTEWTAHIHMGGGELSWAGDTSWDGGSTKEVWASSFDIGKKSWPALLHFSSTGTAARFALTGGSGDRYRVHESSFGFRRYFSLMGISPYLGAGGTLVTVSADYYMNSQNNNTNNANMIDDVTSSKGGYVNLGIMKKMGKYFEAGIDAKAVRGEKVTVELIENDINYNSASVFVGFGF
ncbi:MAG: hypothetical protein OEY64_01180 [Nitrospinota bacterium]|nr:hypothetical protein [Nitrospinota bacterium]